MARNIFYGCTLCKFERKLMEDVLRRQDVDMGWLVGGHFNDQGTGSEDPIGASGISMKSLKEDKNGSVDNAALKPEEEEKL